MTDFNAPDTDDPSAEWVTFSHFGGADLVRLAGEIDMANAPVIGAQIAARTASSGAVLIDLTAVSFLDSAGVRLLDTLVGAFGERRTPIRLVVPAAGPVRLILTICAFREDVLATDLPAAAAAVGR
ncbi:MAG TPA: STAS domain-containing protein [Actinoplanes sp.]|nr:STAS domain-containing protein [Actinoplanes sp.]